MASSFTTNKLDDLLNPWTSTMYSISMALVFVVVYSKWSARRICRCLCCVASYSRDRFPHFLVYHHHHCSGILSLPLSENSRARLSAYKRSRCARSTAFTHPTKQEKHQEELQKEPSTEVEL